MPPKVPPFTRVRQRPALLLVTGLFSLLFLLAVYQPPTIPSSSTLKQFSPTRYFYPNPHTPEDHTHTQEVLSQLYEDERVSLLRQYDQISTEASIRTAPGALNPDFSAYITRLERFVDKYFNGSKFHPHLVEMLNRMVNARPPLQEAHEFNKRVFSFDKDGLAGTPDEFKWWSKRLGPKGWDVQVGNDDKMEEWFQQCAGEMKEGFLESMEVEEDRGRRKGSSIKSGKEVWEEFWNGLGRPVLKSDILRYLILLIQGGLYTDSDTSVLSDPSLWGIHAHDLTPRGLVALQRAMRHLDPNHPSYKHQVPTSGPENHNDHSHHDRPPPPIVKRSPSPQEDQGEYVENAEPPTFSWTPDMSPDWQPGPTPVAEDINVDINLGGFKIEEPIPDMPAVLIEDIREENQPTQEEFNFDTDIIPIISEGSAEELEGVKVPDHLDFASSPIQDAMMGIHNPRVSVVVAVEYDLNHPRQDPRTAYTRDLQIVQWTIVSKPFHPIFLDVLETATSDIMHQRSKGQTQNSWSSVLDSTGPGPFTDAVLRYILVQYGVTAHELVGMENGALIGDILILPLHAFGQWLGGEEDWNAEDPSTRCTAHGFRGRWKGSMNPTRRSRIPILA